MIFRVHKISELLKIEEFFYVYGIGKYAEAFYNLCKKLKLDDKIKGFIVTIKEDNMVSEYHGFPVISACNIEDRHRLVFIATGYHNAREIERIIIQLGFDNVVYIQNYICGEEEKFLSDPFYNKSFKEHCKIIADWYLSNYNSQPDDFDRTVDYIYKVGCDRRNADCRENRLTYITCNIDPRDYKIFSALKNKGYKIDVLWISKDGTSVSIDDMISSDIYVRRCYSEEEILYYALKSDSTLFMIDEVISYAENNIATHMIQQKEFYGKIIFFPYDICHGTYTDLPIQRYINERYIMENADGIIVRYFNTQEYLKESFHIMTRGKLLLFLDYCDDILGDLQEDVSVDVNGQEEGKLIISYVTSHLNLSLAREGEVSEYGYCAPIDDLLCIIGNQSNCMLEVISSQASKEQLIHIKKLEQQYNNVKFHIGLRHRELLLKIGTSDYLADLYTNRNMPSWPVGIEGYSENTYRNATCNKFFDALSAGVPIIASVPEKIGQFLDQYGVRVDMTLEEFDVDYLLKHKKRYKENALKARNDLYIDKHIDKLISFLSDFY